MFKRFVATQQQKWLADSPSKEELLKKVRNLVFENDFDMGDIDIICQTSPDTGVIQHRITSTGWLKRVSPSINVDLNEIYW